MGITEFFADIYSALVITEVHAEEPQENNDDNEGGEEGGEDSKDEGADESESGGDDGGDEQEEQEEEEEEEEDDEPVDPKPLLEEECSKTKECAPAKHHFEHCVERVTAQHENPQHKGPKEDCVEEFFHLQHCATQCAAPKLFKMLK